MAKKAAKKGSAAKSNEKPKAAKAAGKTAPKSSVKPVTSKASKPSSKGKAQPAEKSARAPKLAIVAESADDAAEAAAIAADLAITEVKVKAPKAAKVPKVKPERISAAQRKADKAAADSTAQWSDLQLKHGSEKAQTYDMKAQFEAHKPLQHKVLGWGWIMSVENDRLEVIFQDGKRMLISNYKPR